MSGRYCLRSANGFRNASAERRHNMPSIGETAADIGARYGKYGMAVSLLNTILLVLILFFK